LAAGPSGKEKDEDREVAPSAPTPVDAHRVDPLRSWARATPWVFVVALLVSLLSHVVSLEGLRDYRPRRQSELDSQKVKIRIVEKPKKPDETTPEKKPDDQELKKILETPQTPTEKPDQAAYVGTVDHQAKKETRLAETPQSSKAKNAGNEGNPDVKTPAPVDPMKANQTEPQKSPKTSDIKVTGKTGKLSMDAFKPDRVPRNQYEALLPTNVNDLSGQIDAGFKDYVDDKVAEGDRIDINTTEYRFIGYFTTMRKAIELVWNYPAEASRRGMQGEVGLQFTINKDGKATRIRVVKSSGFPVLDKAIVDAIKLASPFSPLPDGFGRERIDVVGSFRYVLTAYGSH
jgi:protein TonB